MHQSIREDLEEYLKGSGDGRMPEHFAAHLASCESCAAEVRAMQAQSKLLRVLRPQADLEPLPGFYARVLDRIETQTEVSIWSIFLRPSFGRRLAIASALLVLLMGGYLISTEPNESGLMTNSIPTVLSQDNVTLDDGAGQNMVLSSGDSLQQQRDAVLVNLASYHE